MKQIQTIDEWNDLPKGVQDFIITWKLKKGYPQESPLLTIGQAIELCIAVTYGHHIDGFLSGTYNHTLELEEVNIGWDGEELIDILIYRAVEMIKFRLAHTYNSESAFEIAQTSIS